MNQNYFFQKKLSVENPTVTYFNRQGEKYTFTYISEDVVLMMGNFSYLKSISFSENYEKDTSVSFDLLSFYNTYLEEASKLVLDNFFILTYEEFKTRWTYPTDEYTATSYFYKLFRDRYIRNSYTPAEHSVEYNTFNPPGGPYLQRGIELFEGKFIKYFTRPEESNPDESTSDNTFYIHLQSDIFPRGKSKKNKVASSIKISYL